MLTVPGLCWLCRMPLALGHWGICRSAHAPPVQIKRYAPQCRLPATHSHLPCGRCLQKPPPWQRLVTVADYAPPLSPLIHQLKFSGAAESPAPCHVCYWRSTRSSHHRVPVPDHVISVPLWQRRHWRRGFDERCCVSRYHAGCTADGIAKRSPTRPLRPSIFSVPGYANAT